MRTSENSAVVRATGDDDTIPSPNGSFAFGVGAEEGYLAFPHATNQTPAYQKGKYYQKSVIFTEFFYFGEMLKKHE